MQLSIQEYFLLFATSFIVTVSFTAVMRRLAVKFGITDKPNQEHKTHKEPVPYLGGIATVLSVSGITYGVLILDSQSASSFFLATTIVVPAFIMAFVGLVDDIKQLQPLPRFITQNLVAIIVTTGLITSNTLGSPFGITYVDFAVTVFWIVGVTNSINFFDNIDGGASGTVAISSFALFMIAISNGQILIAAMSIVLAGSTTGFLLWNKPPARIYLGDAGALFLGILIASLTVRIDTDTQLDRLGILVPIFLLAIPIMDTSVAVFSRIRRGISPFQGGRDHLSHRLMRVGLDKREAVLALWAASAVFSIFAVGLATRLLSKSIYLTIVGASLWLICFVAFLKTADE